MARVKNQDVLLVGCIMDSRSGSAVEMYHECGYDIIMIDREHTGLNDETILEQALSYVAPEGKAKKPVAEEPAEEPEPAPAPAAKKTPLAKKAKAAEEPAPPAAPAAKKAAAVPKKVAKKAAGGGSGSESADV